MAYAVDWVNKIITIHKADMTQVEVSPYEIYELSLEDFWETIHDLQDNIVAMPFIEIMDNTPPAILGTTTFARTLQIINGWKILFENDDYLVDIVDGNSNLAQNTVRNQVSVYTNNSAGLIEGGAGGSGATAEEVWDEFLDGKRARDRLIDADDNADIASL